MLPSKGREFCVPPSLRLGTAEDADMLNLERVAEISAVEAQPDLGDTYVAGPLMPSRKHQDCILLRLNP